MTTFVRSRRNDNVLIGFFVLVAGGIAIRTQGSMASVIAAVIALGFVGFGVWLHRQPRRELRISTDEIVLVTKHGVTVRIGHAESSGTVAVLKRIIKGQAWFSLVAPSVPDSPEIHLDGFRMSHDELAVACTANGWDLVR